MFLLSDTILIAFGWKLELQVSYAGILNLVDLQWQRVCY